MTVNLSMLAGAGAQFFDNNGDPLSGGKVFTYAAGTTTPQATFTTNAGNVAHANPIVLDSAGRVPSGGEIWLTDSVSYKFLITNSTGTTIGTYDNLTGNGNGLLPLLSASSGSSLVGFLQSGTSATARTVQDKLRETVSVKDFGAVGDGVANDTVAIQNAINSVLSTVCSGVVVFPPGKYKITNVNAIGNVSAYYKNLELRGDGATLLYTLPGGSFPTNYGSFFFRYIDGLTITGFEIDANRANIPSSDSTINHGVTIYSCRNVNVSGNKIYRTGRQPATGSDWAGDGVYLASSCENIAIENNLFEDMGRWGCAVVGAIKNLLVSNNVHIEKSTKTGGSVLGFSDVELGGASSASGITITNNVAYWATNIAISNSSGTGALDNITISGNKLLGWWYDDPTTKRTGAYAIGIFVDRNATGNAANIVISDNIIRSYGTGNAIWVEGVDVSITGNNIVSNGVCLYLDTQNYTVSGNYCEVEGTSAFAAIQLYSTGSAAKGTISGNHFLTSNAGNAQFPVILSQTTDTTFCSNTVFSASSTRSSIATHSGFRIIGNVSNTGFQYITQSGATNVFIGPNHLPANTNLVSAPIEGQKALLPYFSRQLLHHSAAPTTGTWAVGDIVLNNNPSAGGYIGWVCTTAGTPGTWKQFGAILA